jgi:hypothetical protein
MSGNIEKLPLTIPPPSSILILSYIAIKNLYIYRRGTYEANLSALQGQTQPEIWFPGADEDQGRAARAETTPGQGQASADGFGRKKALLEWRKDFPSPGRKD